ncbi:PLP-dependent aspartate aminotransferase family protein [Helicobacter sp. 11-8110]|uniref:trans-sulfuration enzyme family protein n=1 Tax=Helicobacter sp. 11-8110 TaxID=2004997 RepID=UPI000DCAF5AF|nr:PLP-dependent aspartate aminotransferase family protein [Helicobacter sp. 11-8110]RAX53612.1 cystathionine gamma-synthase [Helicobacter sp. 11-8110]
MNFSTKAITTAENPNLSGYTSSDVISPIHLSSTFAKPDYENNIKGFSYSRLTNPTREVLEKKVAALENAKHCIAYASGQAAESVAILSFLKSGDEVICFDDIYGGTRRLLSFVFNHFGIKVTYVDMTKIENIKNAVNANTKAIWLESPTNPLLQICDIKAICNLAKEHNVLSIVDNTFATPFLQRPLDLGADAVLHSLTKYINGHSDSIAGAICLNDEKLYEKLRFVSNSTGMILSPFDSYLNARGVKTLKLRVQKQCENAFAVASFLEKHKKIKKVLYPGLDSHPQHTLAKEQMNGLFGAVVSAYLDTDEEGMKRFAQNLDLFILAESLGGVESLFGCPYYMSHGSVDENIKKQMNITKNLLRFSVGLEEEEDLISALDFALNKI